MGEVIEGVTGTPPLDPAVSRWHTFLAPALPYDPGVLRPCSDTTVNKGPHKYHARAFIQPGGSPTWRRISELESLLPSPIEKEREQKFGIVCSPNQAKRDFDVYTSEPRAEASIGVLFVDIDDFKRLNSRFTESVVDPEIFVPFQEILRDSCIHRGEAYRHGGEEFLLLLPNQTAEEIEQFAERLRRRIEGNHFSVGDDSVQITVSIGVAFWPDDGASLEELIRKANSAEHSAKNQGKNRVQFAE